MIAPTTSHSSVVTLELRAGSLRVPLAQVAHNFAIPREAIELPPCDAEILMTIDGNLTRMPVRLRNGSSTSQRRIDLSHTE